MQNTQESWFTGDKTKCHKNKNSLCVQKQAFAEKNGGHKPSGLSGRLIAVHGHAVR